VGGLCVKVKRLEGEGGRISRHFDNVEDALRYANGEDGSTFSAMCIREQDDSQPKRVRSFPGDTAPPYSP